MKQVGMQMDIRLSNCFEGLDQWKIRPKIADS